jgi:hypothetical protein
MREPVITGSVAFLKGGATWKDRKTSESLNFNNIKGLDAVKIPARGFQVLVIIVLLASIFANHSMLFSKNASIHSIHSSQESTSADPPSLKW